MQKTQLYEQAITLWGEESQSLLAIEEMGELIHALIRLFRDKRDSNWDAVREEIADVEIMIEQLKLIFNKRAVNKIKLKKLRRLEKRIDEAF